MCATLAPAFCCATPEPVDECTFIMPRDIVKLVYVQLYTDVINRPSPHRENCLEESHRRVSGGKRLGTIENKHIAVHRVRARIVRDIITARKKQRQYFYINLLIFFVFCV